MQLDAPVAVGTLPSAMVAELECSGAQYLLPVDEKDFLATHEAETGPETLLLQPRVQDMLTMNYSKSK